MKTHFNTDEKYIEFLKKTYDITEIISEVRPTYFMKIMYENRGFIHDLNPFMSNDNLEMRNPLIVALGDSVTAGHFEFNGDIDSFFYKVEHEGIKESDIIEAIDVKKSYVDIFRSMLIDKYQQTSVSIINSGIAGDTAKGMLKRLNRDVISHDPDLVLINASLNWNPDDGDDEEFYKTHLEIVQQIKKTIKADIILLTPNAALEKPNETQISTLDERIKAIRYISKNENTCLVDIYKMWKQYIEQGYPIEQLLANGLNHPSQEAHELHAKIIMKLFE